MKKGILLILLTMLLTGCKVEYNLNINNSVFIEKTSIYVSNTQDLDIVQPEVNFSYRTIFENINKKNVYAYYDEIDVIPYDETANGDNSNYYFKETIRDNERYGESFYINFDTNDFAKSNAIKNCYDEFNLSKNESIYTLKTNNKCKAFDNYKLLEEIIINITLDASHTIIYSNADNVENSVYTWYINKNNYKSKSISIIYDTEKRDLSQFDSNSSEINKNEKEEEEKKSWVQQNVALILLWAFIGLVLVLGIIIFLKSKTI